MKALELKNITQQFSDGDKIKTVVNNVNFSINRGEFVAIIGPSGSGKSTLLTIAGGLQTPTTGEVIIGDESFYQAKEKDRANLRFQKVGFILQSSNLIPYLTVTEQFLLLDKVKKENIQREKKEELFKQLDILHLKNKYPRDISGGERQRVAIAKALYNNPTIILADEPTASLDTERAYEVIKLLAKEAKEKNKATLMITHDRRMVELCDAVYEMKDGFLNKI